MRRPWARSKLSIQTSMKSYAVWASSRLDSRIYGWSLPDLEYIGAIEVGPTASRMASTPDSNYIYVAVSGSDDTFAIDLETHEIISKMTTGTRPERIYVAVLPPERVGDTRERR